MGFHAGRRNVQNSGRRGEGIRLETLADFESIDIGQVHVQQQQVECALLQGHQSLAAIRDDPHRVPSPLEHALDYLLIELVVFRDEHIETT